LFIIQLKEALRERSTEFAENILDLSSIPKSVTLTESIQVATRSIGGAETMLEFVERGGQWPDGSLLDEARGKTESAIESIVAFRYNGILESLLLLSLYKYMHGLKIKKL
jgi:hypothetical protein